MDGGLDGLFGLADGRLDGRDAGLDDGRDAGLEDGLEAGLDDGRAEGLEDGRDDGRLALGGRGRAECPRETPAPRGRAFGAPWNPPP
ncbi:MAG: hypothetical protein MnENMB40S_15040 [Rhizobiaceae bacterium MnEN-MB40S]|nr:MAG: hypothetical protein MnENMB40S_15040 [Rhizobiaceae bacterium MnEN-MB40S]